MSAHKAWPLEKCQEVLPLGTRVSPVLGPKRGREGEVIGYVLFDAGPLHYVQVKYEGGSMRGEWPSNLTIISPFTTKGDEMTYDAKDWQDAETIIGSGARRVLLYGPPGTGKTYAANHYALKSGKGKRKVFNIYVSEESPAYDVIGHDVVQNGEMFFRPGPAVLAWNAGGRLVINEIDKASGDTLDALLAILDDEESAGYVLPNGEYIEPKPSFQAIATMNGDPDDLPDALKDRFTIRINIAQPHPEAINALPDDLQELARRSTGAKVELDRRMNIRQFRAFEELRSKGVTADVAARACFHHRAGDLLAALGAAKVTVAEVG